MDQSAALGGLMMLVIAGLWVVVFIPSWFQNRMDAQHNREGAINLKNQVKEIKTSVNRPATSTLRVAAVRGQKLSRTKNLMLSLAILFITGSATSVFFAFQLPLLWIAAVASLLVGLVATLVFVRATNELRKLLVDVASVKTEMTARIASSWKETLVVESDNALDLRAWTPNPLPSPAYKSRIGELEMPTLATVTELTAQAELFDTKDEINKILRRRRATG